MNKNLKKVISSLAALAISASAVSAFAANFSDVPEDANYAQAVQELSALDVISGYDDGTFKPDDLVTRAQITKMIVDALNERTMAEASKAKSQFTDVNDHWAQGYINQGVADQFIAGYGDGTFGPDDNVTYVQAQKMLVSALGYETYAQGNGGWPNGYKAWASSQGITAGISGIADDTQLTRAQVAQLVDNAMGAPVCVINGYSTGWDGTRIPDLDIKDETGKDYQTLFTKKHNTYKVYGRVTATSKTNSSMDLDKVEFRVEKADNFDDQWIGTAKNADEETVTEEMYYGDTKAPEYLLSYAEALIQKDTNDEYTIISISAAAATKSVTLAAEDFDKAKTEKEAGNGKTTKIYFYPAGSTRNSQGYAIAFDDENFAVYVNGVESDIADLDALVAYIESNDTAAITLEKQSKVGSTNTTTDYNLVNIVSYKTAIVQEVVAKADRITIYFDDAEAGIGNNLKVDLEAEDISYDFTLDGAAIDPADLEENDVLSIAYEAGKFADSSFYDVIVSRNVVEGAQCTSSSDGEYTFDNGETYKTLFNIVPDMTSSYSLYLDHFGKIAKVDENTANKKIAILKNVYKKAGGDYYAQIITKEGEEVEYKVDSTKVAEFQAVLTSKDANGEADYTAAGSKIAAYPQQVIEYSVSTSTGKISLKGVLDMTATSGKEEYKESSNKLGGIKFNDSTAILDISEAEDDNYDVVSISALTNGNYYEAVGYDETTSGTKYHRFVILTDGIASYNSESQLAVVRKVESTNDDGTTKVQLRLAVNGEEEVHVVDDKVSETFKEGDVILYKENATGYITAVEVINKASGWVSGSWTDFVASVNGSTDAADFIRTKYSDTKTWEDFLADGNSDEITFVFGVVANKSGSSVTIAMPAEYTTADGTVTGIDYDAKGTSYNLSGAKVYAYDFSASTRNGASKVSLDEGMLSTTSVKKAEVTGAGDVLNHTILDLNSVELDDTDLVYAVARVDDDEVKEIFYLYSEN